MRPQLGHELNPALVPIETVAKHSWRHCPAQGMQLCMGGEDARVGAWQ